jgi:hypothetical protein
MDRLERIIRSHGATNPPVIFWFIAKMAIRCAFIGERWQFVARLLTGWQLVSRLFIDKRAFRFTFIGEPAVPSMFIDRLAVRFTFLGKASWHCVSR